MARLHLAKSERSMRATRFHRRSIGALRRIGSRIAVFTQTAPNTASRPASRPISLHRALAVHLSSERMLPVITAVVVLGASLVSFQPAVAAGSTGSVDGPGVAPRIAIGGDQLDPVELAAQLGANRSQADQIGSVAAPVESYANDGTLYKPVAVDTLVADGKGLLDSYTVKSGDTLTGIASRYGISMMTIWWANNLSAKDQLRVGQKLTIPPVNGLVITVKEGDTLDSLASKYKVDGSDILAVNEIEDPNLIIGQTLILPDAAGAPIATPKPAPPSRSSVSSGGSSRSSGGGSSTYSGGKFAWPLVGGGNYISRGFIYGHYGLDIAADYGTKVIAAAAGQVTFAGWKNNGGGYQVWVAHGSGLFTTYNHLASVSVAVGESVGRGEQIGRNGSSGNSTGPHTHFEVWIGPIWNGGYRVSPLRYF